MDNDNNGENENHHLSSFKSMLEDDDGSNNNWYLPQHNHQENNLTFLPPHTQFFFPHQQTIPDNTYNQNFNMETGFLPINTQTESLPQIDEMVVATLTSDPNFATTEFGNGYGSQGFPGLKPLEYFASAGEQPNLFQKRAALGKNSSETNSGGGGNLESLNDVDDLSFDGSGMNYDSDDLTEIQFYKNGIKIGDGEASNGNSTVSAGDGGGDRKGKKKGLPAKNLMAERRRRQKLNDRLFMLRSVVPKISKMDRASILGDAIEYLKELLQKINALNHELESLPSSSSVLPAAATDFYPLTPTATTAPPCISEKVSPSATRQPIKIEVGQRDEGMVNIHMFCSRRPGLLLSVLRTLEGLGIDIQQAVISSFNGFALDVFRAQQCNEVHPDDIKAMLLESAGYHGVV